MGGIGPDLTGVCYVGVDPGLTGAIAAIYPGHVVEVWDMPTIRYRAGGKTKKGNPKMKTDFDGHRLAEIFRGLSARHNSGRPVMVILENVTGVRGDTPVTAFSLGRSKGVIEGILWSFGLPREQVTPTQWKPAMVGRGADKEASRFRAQQLFPSADLSLKKHHGRAEALLIAEFYRRKLLGQPMPGSQGLKG